MLGLGLSIPQIAVLGAGEVSPPAPELQTFSQDFVTFGGEAAPALDGLWTYSGHDTASAYGTGENNSSRLRSFANGPRLGMDRGLQLEPAATNLALNPRMIGATASTFSFSSKVLGTNPFTMTGGTRYFTVTDTAHGRNVGDRVYFTGASAVAGLSPFAFTSAAYNICEIIDANTYRVYHYGATVASGGIGVTTTGGGTPTAWYAPQAANVFPDTFSQRSMSALVTRLITVTDGVFGSVPSYVGALREIEVVGSGSGTQYFTATTAAQGETITFSQIVRGNPRVVDWFLVENTTTVSLVIDEFDSGGTFLTSHTLDMAGSLGTLIYSLATITAQCTDPDCASVKAGWAISAGAKPADFRIQTFEHSLTKTAWTPSISLPAPATKGTATTRPADVLSAALDFSVAAQGALECEFDCKEIVNTRDCIWALGGLRMTVVGDSYPRDLELTDGTNTVTLAGVIVRECPTQQLFRAVASWGPGGLALACAEFLTVASGTVAGYSSGGTTQTLYLGQHADGSEKASCWIKYVQVQNNARDAATLEAHSRWTRNVDPAKWPDGIPGLTLPVGRQTAGAFAGVIAGQSTGTIVPAGSSALGITVTGTGGVTFNATTKIVALGAGVTSLTLENVDMRGCVLLYSMGTPITLTIRNCAFDQPLGTTGTIGITSILNNSASLIEYNDFYGGANTAFLMHIQGLNANHTVRRNKMVGTVADFANLVGGTMEQNLIIVPALPINKHADAFQTNGSSLAGVTFRNNVVDGRRRYGTGADPNSAEIVASTNGPISHSFVSDSNIYLGFTNPIQYRARPPSIGVGGITLWRDGATITASDNLLDMSSLQYLDIKMGAPISISGSSFSISGTASILAKLGLEAKASVTSYTGCAIFETQLASPDALTPLSSAALCGGSGTTRRLSAPFVAADSFTIGGQTFTAFASGASGNNQFNLTDSIATLLGKIAAATGLTVALGSPILPTVTGNASLFRGIPITTY
jgi:hypothetical protein